MRDAIGAGDRGAQVDRLRLKPEIRRHSQGEAGRTERAAGSVWQMVRTVRMARDEQNGRLMQIGRKRRLMRIGRRMLLALTALLLVAGVQIGVGAPQASAAACHPYPDVTSSNPHCANIEWLKGQEITKPADGLYDPHGSVTRGQMAAFLFRLTHPKVPQPQCNSEPFTDVSPSYLFCGYIAWAKQTGISRGYLDNTYRPNSAVSRGAMAAFLSRIAHPSADPSRCTTKPFDDVGIGSPFCAEISWMATTGMTDGVCGGRNYGTGMTTTRQAMATFLHRISNFINDGTVRRDGPPPRSAPPTPHFGIPVDVGNAAQLITVTASSSRATTATVRAWEKQPDCTWSVVHGPYPAWVGSAGIGQQSESTTRTPLGTFTLTEAFGRSADPGTALPYHRSQPNDWWVSDVRSPDYNTLQNCAASACSFNTGVSEHLYNIVPEYRYAVVMDVNRWPAVPGDGSAFFLHVTTGQPTAGCVSLGQANLLRIMRWLNPGSHPRIATGIG